MFSLAQPGGFQSDLRGVRAALAAQGPVSGRAERGKRPWMPNGTAMFGVQFCGGFGRGVEVFWIFYDFFLRVEMFSCFFWGGDV